MNELVIKKNESIIKIENEVNEIDVETVGITVTDPQSMTVAANNIVLMKKLAKALEVERAAQVKPAKDTIKEFEGSVNKIIEKCKVILSRCEQPYTAYVREQERIERERLRAEQEREMAEAKRQAEEAEKHIMKVAEEHNIPDLVEQAIEQSEIAKQKITELATQKAPEVKVVNRGEMGTVSYRDNWTGEVVNKLEALKWIVTVSEAGHDLTYLVDFLPAKLNELARAKKIEKTANGIKIWNNKQIQAR